MTTSSSWRKPSGRKAKYILSVSTSKRTCLKYWRRDPSTPTWSNSIPTNSSKASPICTASTSFTEMSNLKTFSSANRGQLRSVTSGSQGQFPITRWWLTMSPLAGTAHPSFSLAEKTTTSPSISGQSVVSWLRPLMESLFSLEKMTSISSISSRSAWVL